MVAAVDSRPTPPISVRSRGTFARAVSITASDSASSRRGASPLDPSTTIPASRVCIQRAILPARLLWSTDSLAKGVGSVEIRLEFHRKLYHVKASPGRRRRPQRPAHPHVFAGHREFELRPHEQHAACADSQTGEAAPCARRRLALKDVAARQVNTLLTSAQPTGDSRVDSMCVTPKPPPAYGCVRPLPKYLMSRARAAVTVESNRTPLSKLRLAFCVSASASMPQPRGHLKPTPPPIGTPTPMLPSSSQSWTTPVVAKTSTDWADARAGTESSERDRRVFASSYRAMRD